MKFDTFWKADQSGKFYEQATVVNPCLAGCSSLETDSEIVKKEFFGCEIEETTGHSREYLGCGGTSTSLGVCNQDNCQTKIKIYLGLLWWVYSLKFLLRKLCNDDVRIMIPILVWLHSSVDWLDHLVLFLVCGVSNQNSKHIQCHFSTVFRITL